MPTDARQQEEMNAKLQQQNEQLVEHLTTANANFAEAIRQRDEARAELEKLRAHHEGLKRKHAECIEQWVKETNEHRVEIEEHKRAHAELRTLLSVVCDISTKEREQFAAAQGAG